MLLVRVTFFSPQGGDVRLFIAAAVALYCV